MILNNNNVTTISKAP